VTPHQPVPSEFEQSATRWITSPAATQHVNGLLHRWQIRVPTQEILDDVRYRIWDRVQRPHDHLDPNKAPAYCRRIASNLVADVLRGFKAVPINDRMLNEFESESAVSGGKTPAGTSHPGGTALIDHLRGAIEISGEEPWVVSGALTYLTIGAYPDCDCSGSPAPRAGAAPDRARLWPSLWFSGNRTGLFPAGGVQAARQRQALKRAGDRIVHLVQRARLDLTEGGVR